VGGKTTIDPYFKWFFIALRFVVPALALLWLWDLWRRPEPQFHSSWPMPKVRWGIVPAGFLLTVVAGLVPNVGAGVRGVIDLTVIALILAMLVVGIAYLLRVVFPSDSRVEARDALAAEAADSQATDPGDSPDEQ
jgi:peptidoglycan/LPS O-acetylase OafA/YrhL